MRLRLVLGLGSGVDGVCVDDSLHLHARLRHPSPSEPHQPFPRALAAHRELRRMHKTREMHAGMPQGAYTKQIGPLDSIYLNCLIFDLFFQFQNCKHKYICFSSFCFQALIDIEI